MPSLTHLTVRTMWLAPFESTDNACFTVLQMSTLNKTFDKTKKNKKNKKQRHYFINKGPSSRSYGFPSSHVWM